MNFIWKLIARIVAVPFISNWIVLRAMRTPYIDIPGYMLRWWLFNPYQYADATYVKQGWLKKLLPSVRVHCILRADDDDHPHDHPWDARTIILHGSYDEMRLDRKTDTYHHFYRATGDTAQIKADDFHIISRVSHGGVLTLFFTWRYRHVWGFLVDGAKVPFRDYFARKRQGQEQEPEQTQEQGAP